MLDSYKLMKKSRKTTFIVHKKNESTDAMPIIEKDQKIE